MRLDPLDLLTAQSTLGELPAFGVTLETSTRGRVLGEALESDPRLPGVVVTEDGTVRGAISRGQYQRLASRYLGLEVYHPRPIGLMLEAIESLETPLVLAAATPIQEAVRRALERPRALVYEPIIVDGAVRQLLAVNGSGSLPRERRDASLRRVHALKGEAGLLGLGAHQMRLHRLEDCLVAADFDQLETSLSALDALATEARGLIEQFRRLGSRAQPKPRTETETLPAVERLVTDLAGRLGKPARFYSRSSETEIPEKYRPLVREALVQLVRNAMVHGIELPERRRELGKPAQATLQFMLRRHPERGQLEIVFQDDGSGLDQEKIRRRAAELGISVVDAETLARLIFESGFSTAAETTPDAGRGVGLDLVREQVRALGGKIVAHSRAGAFCAFQILLPL